MSISVRGSRDVVEAGATEVHAFVTHFVLFLMKEE